MALGFLGIALFLVFIFAASAYMFAAALTGGIMLMIKRNNYFDKKRKYMTLAGYSFILIGLLGLISLSSCVFGK